MAVTNPPFAAAAVQSFLDDFPPGSRKRGQHYFTNEAQPQTSDASRSSETIGLSERWG